MIIDLDSWEAGYYDPSQCTVASTRSRIRVATVRLAHTAKNCRGRPFIRAMPSDGALAALG